MGYQVIVGECVEAMRAMEADSIDAICADPPYGIGFMGHEWDQPGQHGPVRANGTPGAFASGRAQEGPHNAGAAAACAREAMREGVPPGQRRARNPAPSGLDRDGMAMHAGRYDLSLTANRRFQGWCEAWGAECLRVLKPGGYLLAFGGTRTYHRLASGLEDAGFEVRDCIVWLFGSGFPKSLDVSKALDRAAGAEGSWRREEHPGRAGTRTRSGAIIGQLNQATNDANPEGLRHVYECETAEAERWDGWGTALKPAHEPIVVARKPLVGTVVENVLAHGTGAINVDGCRVGFTSEADERESKDKNRHGDFGSGARDNKVYGEDLRARGEHGNYDAVGRWPANVALSHGDGCERVGTAQARSDGHFPATRGASGYGDSGAYRSNGGGLRGQDDLDERRFDGEAVAVWECEPGCPVAMLDAQTGELKSGSGKRRPAEWQSVNAYGFSKRPNGASDYERDGDAGGASRFFYVAKASRLERNLGLAEGLPRARAPRKRHQQDASGRWVERARNRHPTVKPIELMRWLVRMVCPPGGTVLDPFAGSGTTGCACEVEGLEFIGVERERHYAHIMRARLAYWQDPARAQAAIAEALRVRERVEAVRRGEPVQVGLFD